MRKFWLYAYSLAFLLSVITLIGFIFGEPISRLTLGFALLTTSLFFWQLVAFERARIKGLNERKRIAVNIQGYVRLKIKGKEPEIYPYVSKDTKGVFMVNLYGNTLHVPFDLVEIL